MHDSPGPVESCTVTFHRCSFTSSNPVALFFFFQALIVIGTIAFALYAYFYFEHLHFSVTSGYAKLGFPQAQHQIGQRFLHGTLDINLLNSLTSSFDSAAESKQKLGWRECVANYYSLNTYKILT